MTKAQKQFASGKEYFKVIIVSKSPKFQKELLTTTWKTEKAASNIQRQQKNRLQIIRETLEREYVEECSGSWYHCTLEVLQGKNLEPVAFAVSLRELLTKGYDKFKNILIVEQANCH